MSKFKVGDKVYCLVYGEGQVCNIRKDGPYVVKVDFLDHASSVYTESGQYRIGTNVTLFHTKPEIIVPKRKVKKQIVRYCNVYKSYDGSYYVSGMHESVDSAIDFACEDAIVKAVKYTIDFEVEGD